MSARPRRGDRHLRRCVRDAQFRPALFRSHGLILACDGAELVGFVHAGFGANAEESALAYDSGVICAVLVHPSYRGSGIGRELVRRAETYLREKGAKTIYAGPSEPRDPFFFGLYGGSSSVGISRIRCRRGPFLHCDSVTNRSNATPSSVRPDDAEEPDEFPLRQRPPKNRTDDHARAANISWWWGTRYGRLDSVEFACAPKKTRPSWPR